MTVTEPAKRATTMVCTLSLCASYLSSDRSIYLSIYLYVHVHVNAYGYVYLASIMVTEPERRHYNGRHVQPLRAFYICIYVYLSIHLFFSIYIRIQYIMHLYAYVYLASMTVTEPERRATTMVGTFSLCVSYLSLDRSIYLSVCLCLCLCIPCVYDCDGSREALHHHNGHIQPLRQLSIFRSYLSICLSMPISVDNVCLCVNLYIMHLASITATEPERRATTMVGTFSLCASYLYVYMSYLFICPCPGLYLCLCIPCVYDCD